MVQDGGVARETAQVDAHETPRAKPRFDDSAPLVAYFGPDVNDSAVRRRVAQWAHAGFQVLPFAFARDGADSGNPPEFVNLGSLMPRSLIRRLFPIALAAFRLLRMRGTLTGTQLFIGRNGARADPGRPWSTRSSTSTECAPRAGCEGPWCGGSSDGCCAASISLSSARRIS